MSLGENKVMLQVSITKKQMDDLEFLSKEGNKSKSELVQSALGLLFGYVNRFAQKKKSEKEKN